MPFQSLEIMVYNVLSRAGNYLHLLAMIALLIKVWRSKSCIGISCKSQFLYALVFTTRYMDLGTTFISWENTILKISYIVLTYFTFCSMIIFFRRTVEKEHDTARIGALIIPCIVIAILNNYEFSLVEIGWAFSEYLEAVAMIPQFHLIIKTKRIDKHVIGYIAAIAIYRGLYIANWAYRYNTEGHYDKISVAAGVVQYILYCDFFLQIWPWLCVAESDKQPTVATIECGVPKMGHLADNVGNVLLTPDSLTGFHNDKVNVLASEKPLEKY